MEKGENYEVCILEDSFYIKTFMKEEQEYAEDGTDRSHQKDEQEREQCRKGCECCNVMHRAIIFAGAA